MDKTIWISLVASWLLLASIVEAQLTPFDIVATYSAKGDGTTDNSEALANAWKDACASTTPSAIVIPKGTFLLKQAKFAGPCKAPIEVQLQGNLKALDDPSVSNTGEWVTFNYVDQLTISGGGIFDGQGARAWQMNTPAWQTDSKGPKLPYNLSFNFVKHSIIHDVTTQDSKLFHVMVFGCENVTFSHFTVSAPGTSVNTDGIHIAKSKSVSVLDSNIGTGDDCISVGDGTLNLTITGIICGPGHGISIGSLGKIPGEEPVDGVLIKNITFKSTMNGVRLKTWPASREGVVTNIRVEDITVENVENPVIIDQNYCPYAQCNLQNPSLVKISHASFRNIKGTSATPITVKLDCSAGVPCEDVTVGEIDLTYSGDKGPATTFCANVKPTLEGTQKPPMCATTQASS